MAAGNCVATFSCWLLLILSVTGTGADVCEQVPEASPNAPALLQVHVADGNAQTRTQHTHTDRPTDKVWSQPVCGNASAGTEEARKQSCVLRPRILYWSRTPKCGSETLRLVLEAGLKRCFASSESESSNPHYDFDSGAEHAVFPNSSTQQQFIQETLGHPEPYFVAAHQAHVTLPQAAYLTLLREPVDRCVSQFYYCPQGEYSKFEDFLNRNGTSLQEALSDAPVKYKEEHWCNLGCKNFYTRWLCGMDPRCQQDDQWAYEQARKRLTSPEYVVLDIEDLDNASTLLAHAFPTMFGCSEVSEVNSTSILELPTLVASGSSWTGGPADHRNSNPHPGIDEETRAKANKATGLDAQLYQYARTCRYRAL